MALMSARRTRRRDEPNREPGGRAMFSWLDGFLRSYSQLFFSRSRIAGVLLLLATAIDPRLFAFGALAVVMSLVLPRLLGLSPEVVRDGLYGYNALLVGLAGAAMLEPSGSAFALTMLGVAGCVVATAATQSALGTTFGMPILTVPFLAVVYLILSAAPYLNIAIAPFPGIDPLLVGVLSFGPFDPLLESFGTIFFAPSIIAGALILLALGAFSRIGAALAVSSAMFVHVAGSWALGGTDPVFIDVMAFNAAFTAIALGGIWFVPSPSSFGAALAGVLLTLLIGVGTRPLFGQAGLPLLIFPFNATMLIFLWAMRQRIRDDYPKAVDFLPGTPEENLSYYQTRVARFGARYFTRFRAPFRGEWICTQGVDGEYTHRGLWRYGLDFEAAGTDGKTYEGAGEQPEDFHCFGLPVLAPADGTVVEVVDGVPDNPIGEVNLRDNWGNAVVLQHAPNLFSVTAHLARKSVEVGEGQYVTRGQTLGLCGNSGRSPVPHIHFQLQARPRLGAPTLPVELHDVVIVEEGDESLRGTAVPDKGDRLRNIETAAEVADSLRFPFDRRLVFSIEAGSEQRTETVHPEIDLLGRRTLRSEDRDTVLYYDRDESLLTMYDVVGDRRSILRVLLATLPRMPFEVSASLSWKDHLPRRLFSGPLTRLLLDLKSPFVERDGFEMSYRARRDGPDLIVDGESRQDDGDQPRLRTRATFRNGKGLRELELRLDGESIRATVDYTEETTTRIDDDRIPDSVAKDNEPPRSDGSPRRTQQAVAGM